MQKAMEILKPLLGEGAEARVGKVVIGTVKGDLHDIGKNLVAMMLEGAGFEVKNLGVDVDADRFVEAVKTEGADIVALSALLTTTMYGMKETIEALREAGLRDRVKIMVGGAPVTEEFARDIGADAYAYNAASAVDTAKNLVA
jgi:5-methyltetrahydrofolate--homocysteine methyltransferase